MPGRPSPVPGRSGRVGHVQWGEGGLAQVGGGVLGAAAGWGQACRACGGTVGGRPPSPNNRLHLTPGSGVRWLRTTSVAPAQVKRSVGLLLRSLVASRGAEKKDQTGPLSAPRPVSPWSAPPHQPVPRPTAGEVEAPGGGEPSPAAGAGVAAAGPGSGVVGVRHSPVLAPTHLPGAGGVSPSPGARVRCGRKVRHPVP